MNPEAATSIRCIFCFEEKPSSREDVFPTSIGGKFWIGSVCKDCNDRLGAEVDCLLTDHPLALMMRHRHQITGKSGTIPPLLHTGIMDIPDGEDGTREVNVHMNTDRATGALVPSIIPNIVKKEIGDAGTRAFSGVFRTEAEARKWLQRELKRGGIIPATEEEFEELFKRSTRAASIEYPAIKFQPTFDETSIRKPMLKIAYELAWYWLGDTWLRDPVAKKIRKVLRGSAAGTLPIRGEISLFGGPEIRRLLEAMHIEPHEHLGLLMHTGGRLALFATAFNTFCEMIVVSESPERYHVDDYRGNYVLIDATTGRYNQGPLAELMRITVDRANNDSLSHRSAVVFPSPRDVMLWVRRRYFLRFFRLLFFRRFVGAAGCVFFNLRDGSPVRGSMPPDMPKMRQCLSDGSLTNETSSASFICSHLRQAMTSLKML